MKKARLQWLAALLALSLWAGLLPVLISARQDSVEALRRRLALEDSRSLAALATREGNPALFERWRPWLAPSADAMLPALLEHLSPLLAETPSLRLQQLETITVDSVAGLVRCRFHLEVRGESSALRQFWQACENGPAFLHLETVSFEPAGSEPGRLRLGASMHFFRRVQP